MLEIHYRGQIPPRSEPQHLCLTSPSQGSKTAMAGQVTETLPRAQRRIPNVVDSDELAQKLQQQLQLGCSNLSRTMEDDLSNPPTPEGRDLAPANFAVVAPGIYRSSYPSEPHYTKLADLELKTIITLVPELLPFSYANFISSNGIIHHHIPILANKDEDKYTDAATVNTIMEMLLDRENYPMLIHCNKGKHRTGCMTACSARLPVGRTRHVSRSTCIIQRPKNERWTKYSSAATMLRCLKALRWSARWWVGNTP